MFPKKKISGLKIHFYNGIVKCMELDLLYVHFQGKTRPYQILDKLLQKLVVLVVAVYQPPSLHTLPQYRQLVPQLSVSFSKNVGCDIFLKKTFFSFFREYGGI